MTNEVERVFALRQRYWANGYRALAIWSPGVTTAAGAPLPGAGKRPVGNGWQNRARLDPPEAVRLRPGRDALNTGILCDEISGCDVDVPVQELADHLVTLAERRLGLTPLVRVGNAPKTLLVYRQAAPFNKIATPDLYLPNGIEGGLKCKLEILANGQQFVADGIHPDTSKPYFWTGEATPATMPRADLPAITQEQAKAFVAEAEAILRAAGAVEKKKREPKPKPYPKSTDGFFRAVNAAALNHAEPWVLALFPEAHAGDNGAWRISSAMLKRDLEEDLSIHPAGIWDFGLEKAMSAIDVVVERGTVADALAAAMWLCEQLRIDPKSLGWRGTPKPKPAEPISVGDIVWPAPAALLETPAVPPFPADFLPGAVGEFAEAQAFDLQVPLDFVAIPLFIGAATAIGGEFRMAPKAHANWAERACLWGACIDFVGTGKTAGFNAGLSPIWPLLAKWRDEFQEELEDHHAAVKRAKIIHKQWEKDAAAAAKQGEELPPMPEGSQPPEEPVCREMITNDTTQERVAQLIMWNPRGLLFYRDELSGWFASFNQYRHGADEQFYLQCHAGGLWIQHRKSGDVVIPDVYLAVFGGLQPDVVAAALARGSYTGKPDNGMTARFSLLVWPEQQPHQWVDNSPDRDLRERIHRLFEYLCDLDPERFVGERPKGASHYPALRFTPEGHEVFRDWYVAHHEAQAALDSEAQIKGHFAKYDGLFARLALVHHLLRHAQNEAVEPACVDAVTARAVRRFIDGYLRPHARKIYGHLGRDPGYDGARRIAKWLLDDPAITSFTARDVSQKGWSGLTGRNEDTGRNYLRAALDHLDHVAGWVRGVDNSDAIAMLGGRPTTVYYVNPKIRSGTPMTASWGVSGAKRGF